MGIVELFLIDINHELVREWEKCFCTFENVNIVCGDILQFAENTIVSPANSYGFMDGGIDRLYTEYFGLQPQTEVQRAIERRDEGYLPVGASVLVETGHHTIPYMISAPTMLTPGAIPPSNCFFAMSAVLMSAERNSSIVKKVYCPGLGTMTGRLSPDIAAREMANAYRKWLDKLNA